MNAYAEAMRRYFNFSGNSTQHQFWIYHLCLLGITVVAFIIDVIIAWPRDPQPLLSAVVIMGHYIPSLAIIVRRLHDAGLSGWLALLCLVPGLGIIAFIVFGCLRSAPHHAAPAADKSSTATSAPSRPSEPRAPVADLEKLAALHAAGSLTDSEFSTMKARLLGAS